MFVHLNFFLYEKVSLTSNFPLFNQSIVNCVCVTIWFEGLSMIYGLNLYFDRFIFNEYHNENIFNKQMLNFWFVCFHIQYEFRYKNYVLK